MASGRKEQTPQLLFKNALWERIRHQTPELKIPSTRISNTETLDQHMEQLVKEMARILQELVPVTKPAPYTKRWWMLELTTL